jgi:CheY-like chemotaxis protein
VSDLQRKSNGRSLDSLIGDGQTEFLRQVFAQAPGFIAILRGPHHVFEFANAAYYELIGHREVLGKPVREALPEMKGQGHFAKLDEAYATGKPFIATGGRVLVERIPGKGLEERFVNFVYQPFCDDTHAVVGVCAHGYDVTDLKHTERALGDARRCKDEFIAVLAHELRNPLAPIRQAAKIASMSSATDAQVRWSGEVINRQTEHMALLLDDLLDVSRITRGKLPLRPAPVTLAAVVDRALETARPLIDARHHTLRVHLPPELAPIEADALRLAQIISNLLSNAAKYTDPGGHIELSSRLEGEEILISVSDTGMGIPEEKLASIFEMFSQLGAPIERTEGGLGIGLALVKGLVLLHGGTITAMSAGIGRGSSFAVRLPAAVGGAARRETTATEHAEPSGEPLKVLVVDDNHDAAQSLAVLLSFDGHTLRCACDGAEGLKIAENFRPDVILLDIGLPKLNGYEVAQRLRATSWGNAIILVAITGWGQPEDKRRAMAAGFDRHLTKPVDIEDVRAVLASIQSAVWPQSAPRTLAQRVC